MRKTTAVFLVGSATLAPNGPVEAINYSCQERYEQCISKHIPKAVCDKRLDVAKQTGVWHTGAGPSYDKSGRPVQAYPLALSCL
jgi:hypothetical protein